MDRNEYIVHETERQSGTMLEALGMSDAFASAVFDYALRRPVSEDMVCGWAARIKGAGEYRTTPVYFRSGGHAANHASIPRLMGNLVAAINDETISFTEQREGYTVGNSRADVFTKEFLEIHPFADGNGRVGSILWNYLNETMYDPKPMPYFFGGA